MNIATRLHEIVFDHKDMEDIANVYKLNVHCMGIYLLLRFKDSSVLVFNQLDSKSMAY